MRTPEPPAAEVDIRGTLVGFRRRDVRQVTDRERALIEQLVIDQQREAGTDQAVTRITIETDYPDPDRLAYTTSYRVQVTERGPGAEDGAGECDHRGQ